MSINLAFGNALSGLGATARMAEVVSANLANALTEGYARRSVDLSAASLDGRGAGVNVAGVSRHIDRGLLAERRGAETTLADRRTLASALRGLRESSAPPRQARASPPASERSRRRWSPPPPTPLPKPGSRRSSTVWAGWPAR